MKQEAPREGVFAALHLPCDSAGALMVSSLKSHLIWLESKGVNGVLALGSTGEFPLMTVAERQEALDVIMEVRGNLTVLANVSDINPRNVDTLARHAQEIGIAGVAVMPPSFYPVSDTEQLSFFQRVANASELPVMLYNFPELAGNKIHLETVERFAESAKMFGIKQSGGEFAYHRDLIRLGEEKGFSVFSGADTRLPEVFALGAKGCIGGLVNMVPEFMVGIYRICREGADAAALNTLESRMREVGRLVDELSFPLNVGIGMKARGFEAGCSRTHVSENARRSFEEIVPRLKKLFESWGLESANLALSH